MPWTNKVNTVNNLYSCVILCFMFLINFGSAQTVSLSGTITNSGGLPVPGAFVQISQDSNNFVSAPADSFGNYSMSLPSGTYQIFEVRTMGSSSSLVPDDINVTVEAPFTITVNTIRDIQFPVFPRIFGVVKDVLGNPVENVHVHFDSIFPPGHFDETNTDALGQYELRGNLGDNTILFEPPTNDFASGDVETTGITGDTQIDIILERNVNLSGTILSHDGQPIPGAFIQAVKGGLNFISPPADISGNYSFDFPADAYELIEVRSMGSNSPLVPSDINVTIEQPFTITTDTVRQVNFPYFPLIYGVVTDINGDPVENVRVHMDSIFPPYHIDESITNALGEYQLRGGLGDNTIIYEPPMASGYANGDIELANITTDTLLNIPLGVGATISGIITNSQGLPTPGAFVQIVKGGLNYISNPASTTGSYSVTVPIDTYELFEIRTMNSNSPLLPDDANITVEQPFDVTTDTIKNVQFPVFPRVYGTVKDPDGNPVSNVLLFTDTISAPHGDSDSTDTSGSYELRVGIGFNTIKVLPDWGSEFAPQNHLIDIQIDTELNITLVRNQQRITRFQPSVVTHGLNGSVIITAVGSAFEDGVTTLSFGPSIDINNLSVISPITLVADISVDESTTPSTIDVSAETNGILIPGTGMFTVTGVTSTTLELDGNNQLTSGNVTLSDQTGTFLTIENGTEVIFPTTNTELSLVAPFTSDLVDGTILPSSLAVQRLFSPSGTTFNPAAKLTMHYSDEDVLNIDENQLQVFYYDDATQTFSEELSIIQRQPVLNLITVEISHFSIARVAYNISGPTFGHLTSSNNWHLYK